MGSFNKFFNRCEEFLSSFVDEEDPAPHFERFTSLIVQQLLNVPDLPYNDPSHPFERYASEELEPADALANLASDLNASIVQEGLENLRFAFFSQAGVNRPDMEWLLEYYWKYVDVKTGLAEEEDEDEDEDFDDNDDDNDNDIIPPPPDWNPQLIYSHPFNDTQT